MRVGGRVAQRVVVGVDELGAVRDAAGEAVFVERAAQTALGGGAVVTEDVDEQRVVQLADLLQRVHEPADLVVGVLGETGVELHQGRGGPLLGVGQLVPVRHSLG